MHHADIKARIEKAGDSQVAIAARLKVSPTTVNLVIKGKTHSRRIAVEIAKVVGCNLEQLWPGVYPRKAA